MLLAATLGASLCVIVEHDAPWVLRAGEEILRTASLPVADPFSYTSDRPWLNHEYLAEVLLALAHRAAGLVGVGAAQALVLVLALWALLWGTRAQARSSEERRAIGAGPELVAIALAAALLRESLAPRAQLLSTALFALTMALTLEEWSAHASGQGRARGRLAACVLLGLLWTQVHGGAPHAVVLLGALAICAPSGRRAFYALLAAGSTIAGPYGWRVHEHFLGAASALPEIREWQPLSVGLARGSGLLWAWLALMLAAGGALVLRARQGERVRFQALLLALYGLVALRYVRFATEATLVAIVCCAPLLARWLPGWRERRPRLFGAAATGAALAILGLGVALSSRELGFGLDPTRFPLGAVAHLRREPAPGPLFNSYNFGGYLIWALPEERVFIDGRAFTVYSPEHVRRLLEVYAHPPRFAELEARYGFRLAVLQRRGRGARLLAWLRSRPGWQVRYEDEVAVVLVRPGS